MPYQCYLNNYNIFLRESSRKLYSKTHQIAQVTKIWGVYAAIPLNIVRSNTRVEFLPEEMTFFRTGGRKWKKLISSAEDLEESGINGI